MDDLHAVREIVRCLARYLRANPLACDTLDGIAQWWLDRATAAPEQLLAALERMERDGAVIRLRGADGQVRFRRTELTSLVDARLDHMIEDSR